VGYVAKWWEKPVLRQKKGNTKTQEWDDSKGHVFVLVMMWRKAVSALPYIPILAFAAFSVKMGR
jgi:hypothetical protein